MICAKVLLSCLNRNSNLRKLSFFESRSDVFSLSCNKVKQYSTTTTMTDVFDFPNVKGMKVLDRDAFKKTLTTLCLIVDKSTLKNALIILKKVLWKIPKLKAVQGVEDNKPKIILNPNLIKSWDNFDENIKQELEKLKINESNLLKVTLDLGYENWNAETLLKAVLPEDVPILRSYSLIGHIIHLNIKEDLLDYKYVIGEILLDKVPQAKTVICKKNIIESVYRNFEMEVLCGEPNFITSACENRCRFELDFSKVYWNPRLSTEHSRVLETLKEGDVLFDLFAGIGPFAIPAAKMKCFTFANDLNPESVKWLNHNITLNKKAKDYIMCFNKDAKDFILNEVKENLLKFWMDDSFGGKIHVVMNLPALAPTFMKYFKSLFKKSELSNVDINKIKKCLPIVNCYFFTHGDECGKTIFEQHSEMNLNDIEHSLNFVRKISDSGSMLRIVFTLPFEYLVDDSEGIESEEPLPKRICIM